MPNITEAPDPIDFVRFSPGTGQRFIVTVDTEEEFDWGKPLASSGHSTLTVARLARFQQFCEGFGICPIYLVDHPIVTSPVAAEVLREPVAAGRAEVGIQLHPWVSPPFEEEVTPYNSFAGNLPRELEAEKLKRLRDGIEKAFGAAPAIYRAGRYGLGPNTAELLVENRVAIDTSVRARFDYSYQGGPNYRDHPLRPYWVDRRGGLMELPLTTVFWGPLRQLGDWLYPRLWRIPRMRGLLSRARLLERIPLTPEGTRLEDAMRGIDIAVDEGLPILVLSFHSPSLAPGFTPYVRSEDDLDVLYDWFRGVFTYLAKRGVAPTSVKGIMNSVELA